MAASAQNLLGITTSVRCVAGVVDYVVKVIERDLLPKCRMSMALARDFTGHLYGCGVTSTRRRRSLTGRTIHNIALSPNFWRRGN